MATTNPYAQLNYSDYTLATQPLAAPPVQPATPAVQPAPKPPNKFLSALGKVVRVAGTVAGNVFMPGLGGATGNLLGEMAGLGSDPVQYLKLQEKIQAESRMYEAASAVLKAKHDAAMDCLRNIAH
jgi:hypothetical protein